MSEEAIVGGGCFWCIEASFKQLESVEKVTSGYAGGDTENPTYRQVCSGGTGHAEVVKIEYDEEETSYREILKRFFRVHNPTTKNKEGPDRGSQYRSIILYKNENQKDNAEEVIDEVSEDYEKEIVTEVKKLNQFYKAEEKHQDYFEKNPDDAYCTMHAEPKMKKING